jgi:hypothetical protein
VLGKLVESQLQDRTSPIVRELLAVIREERSGYPRPYLVDEDDEQGELDIGELTIADALRHPVVRQLAADRLGLDPALLAAVSEGGMGIDALAHLLSADAAGEAEAVGPEGADGRVQRAGGGSE